ncbi:uncharacterized protein V6R79_008200 [Siganus canaliculatus]
MLGNPGSYANKKRKKPVPKQKKSSDGNEAVKSNPSKRHRDRLNGELDRLTGLLPFSEDIRSRLDKLSVLRLSVGYLRVKSYFNATMKKGNNRLIRPRVNGQNESNMAATGLSEGECLLQALNGFVIVVTSEGLVFYVSPTIKDYLGFHQSDVVHQSVFDLIHTDDRALFRQQLHFSLNPPHVASDGEALQGLDEAVMYSPEQLPPENSSFLERSFVCRFRCLLDNSSGFLALRFQGRLKFLHGQNIARDNGTGNKCQLALFSIAMPVQPPSIVALRAKLLLFQSKHKLDFTPLGIDNRGKVILGYSETELCMKGSGYQFIHAADMMYCADNHTRMMKTGESGLTVFRLLSKSAGWVWVKSNARLIYKDGRPDFIIACQRAILNSEGEEYLRQRRLQLPFASTTGEAILYDTGPTVDISQFQFNKMFGNNDSYKDVAPGSLLDCFLKQDEAAYTNVVGPILPVDQVFMESRALLSIPSDAWQGNGSIATSAEPFLVKTEAKQSVMSVIGNLEKIAHDRDLCSGLQNLDVPDTELMEWENTLKRISQEDDQLNSVSSDLDSILTNDVFDYIDGVLFKERGEDCLGGGPLSCLAEANSHQQAAELAACGLSEPPLFPTPSPDRTYSPPTGIYSHQQSTVNAAMMERLSHHPPVMTSAQCSAQPLQQLQLQDIFCPSIELPQLTVAPEASANGASALLQPHMGYAQHVSGLTHASQVPLCPPQSSAVANGQFLPNSRKQAHSPAAGVMDILPPLIPCNDFSSSSAPSIPIPYATTCLQGPQPLQAHNQQVQQWPQSQQQKAAHADIVQNGCEQMPVGLGQPAQSQTFPHAGLWPKTVAGLNHGQQGGLACGQAVTHNSCMFQQHFASSPAGGDVMTLSGSPALRGGDPAVDLSPPQASCFFQWNHDEAVVGAMGRNQESSRTQTFLDSNRHTRAL